MKSVGKKHARTKCSSMTGVTRGPWAALIFCLCLVVALPGWAQQKGQYVPGQFGLNSGIVPDPGLTYVNLALNYSADQLNDQHGNAFPAVTGTYSFWVDENIFMYVPKHKILGGYYAPYISVNAATGSLVADFALLNGLNLNSVAGGSGLADTWVEPLNLGWHLKRADLNIGYGFMAPTGRFEPGASDNVGSGYWGNNLTAGGTFYITKNKGTSANIYTDWEGHTRKHGTNITPGQAFTLEWGLGQALPLKKDESIIGQLGFVGYDQWQVSDNAGTVGPIQASRIPHYSVHALGVQANLIAPEKGFLAFFKYYGEYVANARVQGRTIVFGFNYTFRIPKKAKASK